MATTTVQASHLEKLLEEICARDTSAEIRYEDAQGQTITGHLRLLKLTESQILGDRPQIIGEGLKIPTGRPIEVYLLAGGARCQFRSVIEATHVPIHLNESKRIRGVALRRPKDILEVQRRADYRISGAGSETTTVSVVRCHPTVPDACPIDAQAFTGSIADISAGGMALVVPRTELRRVKAGECFFLEFRLRGNDTPFFMRAVARHSRVIERIDGLRIGFAFQPWGGAQLNHQKSAVRRFVADEQRRTLRRGA